MTMLSPAATYHAELREQLGTVGRASSVQRGLLWLARGLAAGTVVVLGLVVWAWVRDAVASPPILLLIGLPIALVTAAGSRFMRHNTRELARGVARSFRLPRRRCAMPSSTSSESICWKHSRCAHRATS